MSLKILIVYSDRNCSCTRKCTFEFAKGLRNFTEANTLYFLELKEEHFIYHDIIIFQRLGGNGVGISLDYLKFVEKLITKYRNKTLTYYNIDDLLDNNVISYFMQIVDRLLFPNINFVNFYSKYNRNADITGPYIDIDTVEKIIPQYLGNSETVRILWGSTALVGIKFMQDLIPKILTEIPNSEIYIMGRRLSGIPTHSRVIFKGILSFESYIALAKSCDIHLNPISIDSENILNNKAEDFLKCKSPIKFLNAAILKKVMVTSNMGNYPIYVKNYENGIILENNPELWISALKQVIQSKQLQDILVANAYNFVKENYTVTKAAEKMIKIFKERVDNQKNIPVKTLSVSLVPDVATSIPPEPPKENKLNIDIQLEDSGGNIGQLLTNRVITQEFRLKHNHFCGFALLLGTYKRKNNTHITVELFKKGNTAKPLYSIRKNVRDIEDNSWVEFLFPTLKKSANTEFILRISSLDAVPNNAITLFYSAFTSYGLFKINSTVFKGSLSLKTYYR